MGMQNQLLRHLGAALMIALILPTMSVTFQSSPVLSVFQDSQIQDGIIIEQNTNPQETLPLVKVPTTSDTDYTPPPMSGTLNPVQVEQSGYSTIGNISARTDTILNTDQTLAIDSSHDWVASTANVNVWNLKRMYAENGTFDDGYPGVNVNPTGSVTYHPLGWDAISSTSDSVQTQIASYALGTDSYIIVENQGTPVGPASDRDYQHSAGTNISWTQNIANVPYTEDFILIFRYFYFRGPIGSVLSGNCSIVVYVDGSLAWKTSLLVAAQRGTWFDSGAIEISRPGIGSNFEIEVGLSIDGTMTLDPNTDYDGDSYLDGLQNTFYITAFIDDVSLLSASSPDCETVGLEFSINGSTAQITGALGSGFGQISNSNYWDTNLDFLVYSNTSVSFDYTVHLLNHRFLNSSWTTDTLHQGVAYTIESGLSGKLALQTYLGFLGVYEDLTLTINHPSDWENFTILDPFLSDVTASCIFESHLLTIPDSLLDRLGWWKITCDAPNYALATVVERYESSITDWVNESIFHSDDSARLSISLGTANGTPILTDPVNFTWAFPNSTVWYQSSTIGGINGNTSSSVVNFGPTNTTAGIWGANYIWSNGSELAYDCTAFAIHHVAILESVYSTTLETVVGQPVSVFLRFLDAENGLYIMNDGAQVVGNWSSGDIEFTPDIVKNWWQADFDTALVGAGEFSVLVVSAAPYFETVPLIITIKSHYLTTLNPPSGPLAPLIYGRQYSLDFVYSTSYNGTGIDGANIVVSEEGSEWVAIANTGNGHYNLTITPMGIGDYNVRIIFSKEGYETKSYVLSFLVNKVPIEIASISSLVGLESTPLTVEVSVAESDTGMPVDYANVTLGVYRPGGIIYFFAEMNRTSVGIYSVDIPMPRSDTGTYTVNIAVEKENCEMTQSFSAALVPIFDSNVRLVQTVLEYSPYIGIGVIAIISAVSIQRSRVRKRKEKNMASIEIKNRINDANNILGFLVLHKLSGVPIYKKIFKGGFEEGMLSAFISAIMHFRSEFETGRDNDDYTIIPISENIRTVPTHNLICAFITMTPPSMEQEGRMRNYARAIGMMFDDTLAERPDRVIDAKSTRTFELMFDEFMDGILIQGFQVGGKKFPRQLRFIEKAIPLEAKDGTFNLVRLIRLLISSGYPADDVYILMFKAIEADYIIPVDTSDNNYQLESD